MSEKSIVLTQHTLGLKPYVLIELDQASDGSGEPALFVECGGGAEEEPFYLPLLVVTEAVADEKNPLADMLREICHLHDGSVEAREAIAQIVEQINPEWWPYVSGDQVWCKCGRPGYDERHARVWNDPEETREPCISAKGRQP